MTVSSNGGAEAREVMKPGQSSEERSDFSTRSEPGQSEPEKSEGARRGPVDLGAISELLRGAAPETEEAPDELGERAESVLDGGGRRDTSEPEEGYEEPAPRRSKPSGIRDAAEALGIEPSEVYSWDVPLGDGSTVKLGELKDNHERRARVVAEIAKRETALSSRESALNEAENSLADLLEVAGSVMSEGTQREIRARIDAKKQRVTLEESAKLQRAMPELADPAYQQRFGDFVLKFSRLIGWSPEEVLSFPDHRVYLALRYVMNRDETLEGLSADLPPMEAPRPVDSQGRGSRSESPHQRAKRTGKGSDVNRAISHLIGGRR